MNGRPGVPESGALKLLETGFNMMSVYQIGAILFVAVGVLGSALLIAWRDAGRAHRQLVSQRTSRSL